jgi:predicted RNA-binding Zn-ribbon protein involved in translation (DUF1610 family)
LADENNLASDDCEDDDDDDLGLVGMLLAAAPTHSSTSSVITRSRDAASGPATGIAPPHTGGRAAFAGTSHKPKLRKKPRTASFRCSFCPKMWDSVYALERHENSHTGNKPYKCPECGQRFSQGPNLKVHVESIHEKTTHMCLICFKFLSTAINLNHHMTKTHAVSLRVQCSRCETWMRGDLNRHQTTALCKRKQGTIQAEREARVQSLFSACEEASSTDAQEKSRISKLRQEKGTAGASKKRQDKDISSAGAPRRAGRVSP